MSCSQNFQILGDEFFAGEEPCSFCVGIFGPVMEDLWGGVSLVCCAEYMCA